MPSMPSAPLPRAVPAPLARRVVTRSGALAVAAALSLAGLSLGVRPAVADNAHPPHPPIVIDDFTTAQQAVAYPSPSQSASVQSTVTGAGILGGERYVSITTNADASLYRQGDGFFACINTDTPNCPGTNAGTNQFATFRQIGVYGSLTLAWDGTGNDPATLNPTGLGHVDLTSGGVRNALLLAIPYYNAGVSNVVVTAYTDSAHASRISFATPGSMNGPVDPPVKEILKFVDFTAVTGKSAATFTDIGAITISFDTAGVFGGMGPYFSLFRTTDTVPPVLSLPANIATQTPNASGTPVTFAVSAVDAADGDVAPSCDHNSGDTFPIGTTTVHCSATDTEENTSMGNFTVTVTVGSPPNPGPTATPELGSGELLATGLLPLGLALLVRRRRTRRTT